jgi:mannosyl-oligosaccharide glucosidase
VKVACRQSASVSGKCKELFGKLRENLMGNVLQQYEKSLYTWENYSDKDGKGQGTHPFGWTALIALIALDEY